MSVVSVVCCQAEVSATSCHLSRGVLPTVVHHCVWFRNLVNEEALAHWGAVAPPPHSQKQKFCSLYHSSYQKTCLRNLSAPTSCVKRLICQTRESQQGVSYNWNVMHDFRLPPLHEWTSILLDHYTAQNKNFMLTFWDIMMVPSSYKK
jgi:hypothetical protein